VSARAVCELLHVGEHSFESVLQERDELDNSVIKLGSMLSLLASRLTAARRCFVVRVF